MLVPPAVAATPALADGEPPGVASSARSQATGSRLRFQTSIVVAISSPHVIRPVRAGAVHDAPQTDRVQTWRTSSIEDDDDEQDHRDRDAKGVPRTSRSDAERYGPPSRPAPLLGSPAIGATGTDTEDAREDGLG